MDLIIWCSKKIIKFGADLIWRFLPFASITPNFLRVKIYPNEIYYFSSNHLSGVAIVYCHCILLSTHKQTISD